ncbi:MAG: hypothetical protein WA988_20430 [Candidatus Nanopelagicales bacterium]
MRLANGSFTLPDTPEVRAALADPKVLLDAADAGGDGWAVPFGGPQGVAQLTGEIRHLLEEQARDVAALRAVAVAELLRDQSMSVVGQLLGIGKSAVHKINQAASGSPFEFLLARGQW